MSLTGRHITAGDLTPVTVQAESTYGTPTGDDILYGDVAEGGRFTFTDTANPYLSWRYGSRSFNPNNYVTQQKDAGFSASLEVRDVSGWGRIIDYAVGIGGTSTDPLLPSRTEEIYAKIGAEWNGRTYNGCKTDKLTISADAPGGVVKFEEEVLAMKSAPSTVSTAKAAWSASATAPAVQWMGGMRLAGVDIYPQSFKLSIMNNLERIRVPNDGEAITGSLLEGRREMELEAEIWMEDFALVNDDIANDTISGESYITLGITNRVRLSLPIIRWMANGSHPDLIQDKQRQTIRLRVASLIQSQLTGE